ncbi:hypothetical protein [Mycobacterium leprae]|uniref:hypothetical protein n=1 Tax=Mycobacterium leprae TaxID=1769 RepID=UPI0012E84040|nr:hypothetical protein [Mycobacterium leprae]
MSSLPAQDTQLATCDYEYLDARTLQLADGLTQLVQQLNVESINAPQRKIK